MTGKCTRAVFLKYSVGQKSWDHQPMLNLLAKQVGEQIGDENAVIALQKQHRDPTSFPKQGKRSVGVARPWCGRLGKIENCQVAVCMSLASGKGHALVNVRLYMPKQWDRKRMAAAGGNLQFHRRPSFRSSS